MEQLILKVKLFGDFSVTRNGEPVDFNGDLGCNAKLLLQFLICKLDREVGQDEIVENLFSNGNTDRDPVQILKESMDALREAIGRDCIQGEESLCINRSVTWDIDVEQFEIAVKNALSEGDNTERRLGFCLDALAAYSGEFLPESSGFAWVTPYVLRYQEMCYYCVKTVYRIYTDKRDLLPMIGLLERVMAIYPLEEEFRILYISSLYSLDRIKEAVEDYEFFTTLLYDELGIAPSEEMLDLYKKITGTLNSFASSIAFIRTDLVEEAKGRGAYYCNYQSFTNTYRFVVRHIERSGQTAFLMLVTFCDADSDTALNKKMQKISLTFHNVLHGALRRGDVYARYSPTQFILLLMDIGEENCKIVSGRIQERFFTQIKDSDVKLHFKVIPALEANQEANKK
ncbi:MAG: bacterial transcriptional activator domain-containing protein [Eubacteriales bacterium]